MRRSSRASVSRSRVSCCRDSRSRATSSWPRRGSRIAWRLMTCSCPIRSSTWDMRRRARRCAAVCCMRRMPPAAERIVMESAVISASRASRSPFRAGRLPSGRRESAVASALAGRAFGRDRKPRNGQLRSLPFTGSPTQRLSAPGLAGHRAGLRQVSCPRNRPSGGVDLQYFGTQWPSPPSGRDGRKAPNVLKETDNSACDEIPRRETKIVTFRTRCVRLLGAIARAWSGPGWGFGLPRSPADESDGWRSSRIMLAPDRFPADHRGQTGAGGGA